MVEKGENIRFRSSGSRLPAPWPSAQSSRSGSPRDRAQLICRALGLDVVLHGWFELGIAAAAYTHLAAAYAQITRAFDYTLHLYDDVIEAGQLPLSDGSRSHSKPALELPDKRQMLKLKIDETVLGT